MNVSEDSTEYSCSSKKRASYLIKPTVNSPNAEERKLARRLRLEQRLKVQRQSLDSSKHSSQLEDEGECSFQLRKSAAVIEQYMNKSEYDMNKYVAENNSKYNKRMVKQKMRQKELMKDIELRSKIDEQKFQEIISKWTGIQKLSDPVDVYQRIREQAKNFDSIIKRKNEFIIMLKNDSKRDAVEYNRKTLEQNEEMENLKKAVEEHILTIRNIFKKQYNYIAGAINRDNEEIFYKHQKKWENYYKTAQTRINDLFIQKVNFRETLAGDADTNELDFEEDYRDVKIIFETSVDQSRQELIKIKFMVDRHFAALNNCYGVLDLRSKENIIIKALFRRKMVDLQYSISHTKQSLKEYKQNFKTKSKTLQMNIDTRKADILALESKAKRLAEINENHFIKLWELVSKDCQNMMDKIIGNDQILHEQYMGIEYNSTQFKRSFSIVDSPGYQKAVDMMTKINPEFFVVDPRTKSKIKHTKLLQSQVTDDATKMFRELPPYKKLVKHILTVLSDKSGFLTEKRMKDIIKTYEDNDRTIVKLDNIFYYMGVYKPEDIDIIAAYFRPYCYCQTCCSGDSLSAIRSTTSRSSVISASGLQVPTTSELTNYSALDNSMALTILNEALTFLQLSDTALENIVLELASWGSCESLTNVNIPNLIDDTELVVSIFDTESVNTKMQQSKSIKKSKQIVQCIYAHSLVLKSAYALEALKTFVAGFFQVPDRVPTMRERMVFRRNTVVRLIENKEIKDYWTSVKNTFDQKKIHLWDTMKLGLKKYLHILEERKQVAEEVVRLRKRNKKLKELIEKYKIESSRMAPVCKVFQQDFVKPGHELNPLCRF